MSEYIWCPECDVECQYLGDNLGGCPECGTRWAECPDCGEVVDVSEDWSVDEGLCNNCADDSPGITILDLTNMDETVSTLEKFFGRDENS